MDTTIEQLERLIQAKVAAGIFPSIDAAVDAIGHWLNDLEEKFIVEQMRNEDA